MIDNVLNIILVPIFVLFILCVVFLILSPLNQRILRYYHRESKKVKLLDEKLNTRKFVSPLMELNSFGGNVRSLCKDSLFNSLKEEKTELLSDEHRQVVNTYHKVWF